MIPVLLPQLRATRTIWRSFCLIGGFLLAVFALAGPRFGVYYEDVRVRGADIFILLDVSRSMLAGDLPPNRLERAKSDIRDLLEVVRNNRVGLIVFAGKPIVRVPLTNDHVFLLDSLKNVDTNSAPRGGTAVGDAIRQAILSMSDDLQRDRWIIMLTDGEDHDSFAVEAAREVNAKGIKLILVGLGDAIKGARIPIGTAGGNPVYLRHDGTDVWSKVDERLLAGMARESGGLYIPAGVKTFDLGRLYAGHVAGGRLDTERTVDSDVVTERRKQFRSRYQIFLAAGLLLLVLFALTREYTANEDKSVVSGTIDGKKAVALTMDN